MAAVNMQMAVFDADNNRMDYGASVIVTCGAHRGEVATYIGCMPATYSSQNVCNLRLQDGTEFRLISKLLRKVVVSDYVKKW